MQPFSRHFKGSFHSFDSARPPPKIFENNKSCEKFTDFTDITILDRAANGAISGVGKVGETSPPHLVMPLTVEPTKPRLCHDNRLLNLWMQDRPSKIDNLSQLPRYLGKDAFQTVLYDKSGYHHILLDKRSWTHFGMKWRGWYFVSNTILLVGNFQHGYTTPPV